MENPWVEEIERLRLEIEYEKERCINNVLISQEEISALRKQLTAALALIEEVEKETKAGLKKYNQTWIEMDRRLRRVDNLIRDFKEGR